MGPNNTRRKRRLNDVRRWLPPVRRSAVMDDRRRDRVGVPRRDPALGLDFRDASGWRSSDRPVRFPNMTTPSRAMKTRRRYTRSAARMVPWTETTTARPVHRPHAPPAMLGRLDQRASGGWLPGDDEVPPRTPRRDGSPQDRRGKRPRALRARPDAGVLRFTALFGGPLT